MDIDTEELSNEWLVKALETAINTALRDVDKAMHQLEDQDVPEGVVRQTACSAREILQILRDVSIAMDRDERVAVVIQRLLECLRNTLLCNAHLLRTAPEAHRTNSYSVATATRSDGSASNEGVWSAAVSTGCRGRATNSGYGGVALVTSFAGQAATSEQLSVAVCTGSKGNAVCKERYSIALSTGNKGAAEVAEKASIAIGAGLMNRARAPKGGALVLCTFDGGWNIADIRAAIVGKKYPWGVLKPNTWYTLAENGDFVEEPNNDQGADVNRAGGDHDEGSTVDAVPENSLRRKG